MPAFFDRVWNSCLRAFLRLWEFVLAPRVTSIHQGFFRFFNDTFFPIEAHLTPTEIAYIHRCFQLARTFVEIPEGSDYDELSYFTYSHRVKGDQVNSSRIAFGSIANPEAMLQAALPVLHERSILLEPSFLHDSNLRFYGLGWDILDGHLKVYFRVLDLDQLPQASLQTLLQDALPSSERRKEGLVSFTFQGAEKIEEKVYVYPLPKDDSGGETAPLPGSKGRVLMASSVRGVITQYDVSETSVWRHKLNPTGQAILDTYARQGYTLDTIVIEDPDHFTLYFPGAFFPFLSTYTRLRQRLTRPKPRSLHKP